MIRKKYKKRWKKRDTKKKDFLPKKRRNFKNSKKINKKEKRLL